MAHACPTCQKPYAGDGPASTDWPAFPFCSARCQLVDLGKWFNGEYRISEPLAGFRAGRLAADNLDDDTD